MCSRIAKLCGCSKSDELEERYMPVDAPKTLPRNRQLQERQEAHDKFNSVMKQVMQWVEKMEDKVDRLPTIGIEPEALRQQMEVYKPLQTDYDNYNPKIDEVNTLGMAVENLSQDPDLPTSKASPLRRSKLYLQARSDTRSLDTRSISSRRSSLGSELDQSSFLLEDGMSEIQRQLVDANERYQILGDKLAERKFDLEGTQEKAQNYKDELRDLLAWMDQAERALKSGVPIAPTTDEAKKTLEDHLDFVGDIDDHSPNVASVHGLGDELTVNRTNQYGADTILGQLAQTEDRWIRLQDKAKARTQDLESAINSLSDFEQAYNRLKTWLGEKDKMMGVLGPIGVEPGILRNQKQQVEVLQDEFRAHEPQMEQFIEAGQALLDKQDPRGRKQSPVQQQLGEVQGLWDDLKKKLDDRQNKIDDILDESEKFHNALQDNSDWLIDFGNRISSLAPISSNPDGVRQQMDETKALQREADRKKLPIEDMAESHQQLTALNPEMTAKAEVTLKLDSVRSPYQELCRKLDERQGKLQAALLQSKDFEDSYANMIQWLDAKEKELNSSKPISAKPEVLRRQLVEQEEIPKEIVKQVYTYERMLDKLQQLTDEAPRGPEKDALQRQHNALQDKWGGVNQRSGDRLERLQDCNNKAKQYTDELNQFLPWLRSAEDRLASLGPVAMKPNIVKRQHEILKQLQDDIDNHRDHHQAVNQSGDELIRATDIDDPYITDQVEDANKRWEQLQKDVGNQLETLEQLTDRLNDFQDQANQSQVSLANIEEKLASHDAMGSNAKDPKNLDKLKMLADEVATLEDSIIAVKDNSGNLMAAAPPQADTGQINDEVDGMVRRYEKLKNLVDDRYSQMEAGSQEVVSFQGMLNDIQDNLDESEDILDKFDPVARDLDTLNAQTDEIQKYQDNLEHIKGELMKADRVFRDIIDKGYLSDNEGFRDQIDSLNKKWNKLRDRANVRHADIDKAVGKLHDLDRILQEVSEGLDKAEANCNKMKPIGADVDTVKQQQKEFKAYLRNFIDPLVPRIREANRLGQNLIQSADPRVNTSVLEGDMENMNERWNRLNAKNSDREAKLNEGLLRCGKFQEALNSLMSWIGDTEELVSHQKDPSSDYKVVKAQLSEQQLLDRLITDREPSVEALKEMGDQLSRVSEPQDRMRIQQQLNDLERRWGALVDAVRDRRRKLEQTAENAKDFQSQIAPLTEWMDKVEQQLTAVEPVATERAQIQEQIQEQQQLHDGIEDKKPAIRKVVNDGQELLKQCAGKEIIDVQQKLDSIQNRYDNIQHKSEDRLHQLEQAIPLAADFDRLQREFSNWLGQAEKELRNFDPTASTDRQKAIQEKLQREIDQHRPMLGELNEKGTKLIELSPGQGAADIRQQLSDANERYGELSSQVKDIEYRLSAMLEGAQKVEQSVDELLASLNDAENQLDASNRETISVDPNGVRDQLKKAKQIDRDINSKMGRMQDTIGAAEKVLEQIADPRQRSRLDQRLGQLKDKHDKLSRASSERVETLEEALPLTLQFNESHDELSRWLNDAEDELKATKEPGLNADEIKKAVDKNRFMKQSVAEKQAHVDKLNKIGPELAKLSPGSGARSVEGKLADDNKRYDNVKDEVKKTGDKLFDRLQRTSSFIEDLDSILENLNITAEKLSRPDPISSDPEVLKKQIKKLQALQDEVEGQMDTVDSMRKAGNDMINQTSPGDPYVRELRDKLDQLGNKWDSIVHNANERSGELRETLHAATSFWEELNGTQQTIRDLHEQIRAQEPPALEEAIVKDQQDILQVFSVDTSPLCAIKEEIDAVAPELDMVRQSADDLIRMCGEADKPEVEKNMDELQINWEALNNAYKDANDALTESANLARQFQDGLDRMNDYMDVADDQLDNMQPVGSDPDTVKHQLDELRNFRREQDSKNLDLEAVNQQGSKLLNKCTDDTRELIQGPLSEMNRRWKNLAEKTFDRQHKLEAGLLALGQLESSLDELLNWMDRTDSALDNQKPLSGDPKMAEIELAKHKVLQNDIHSHQPTVDSINQAARSFVSSSDNRHAANAIKGKLDNLNGKWRNLLKKSDDRQRELEDALGQTNTFQEEANRLMRWLNDLDSQLSAAQPVGGLPETAREQLDKHKDLMRQLDREQISYDRLMESGRQLRRQAGPEADREGGVGHTMQQLQDQWEATRKKADDRKAKLDDAFKQAQAFHDDLQSFITWLTTAERTLNAGKPPSTVLENINQQIAEHKEFLYSIADKKETMKELDKTGTQLKYFSQKQDVILIKNLLISVQNRWEKVQSRCQERSRQLDSGFKRAKQFKDNYDKLFKWLEDSENTLDQDRRVHSDPDALKDQLRRHKEFQRSLGAKQPMYDTIVRTGRALREKSNPTDTKAVNGMLSDLKDKWDLVCGKSVDRQRKLEEALLYSGQFKDALQALLEWLYQVGPVLSEDNPVHGDIDTVMNMMEAHKGFQRDLGSRKGSVKSVNKSSKELKEKSSESEDLSHLNAKVEELNAKWDDVCQLSVQKQERLEGAMKEAEEFHEAVHMLLEWLADAEQGLRFHGPLSEDEEVLVEQLETHKDFKKMFAAQESKLNDACHMGDNILTKCHPDAVTVVKHWITVLQARWEEINNLSQQRQERLSEALQNLKTNAELLENLMKWLEGAENTLQLRDSKPVADDIPVIQKLLDEHQSFEDEMASRQPEVDKLTKAHKRRRSTDAGPSGIPNLMLDRSRPGRGRSGRRSREPSPGPDSSRNPRVSALFNKWKQVWLMAMDRRRRLQDALDRQAELKKLEDFKFPEWRDRYVRWMNHKKARVMDFFRKLDLDRDGKLSRSEFIQGIIGSKFPTNQLEMNAVADIFDADGNGYINYKEFIAALWPEKVRGTKPETDQQKIEDEFTYYEQLDYEVKKQVHMCTCIKKFKIQRVGESKYRFGESQQLRLVRILRSTVMVRVGGGWMALDEFLVKNDPCRAKGRTNIELRERFILADGVSQSMTSFGRPRRSRSPSESSTGSASSRSLTGPILKIKEKRNIARPWQQSPVSSSTPRRLSTHSRSTPDGTVTRTKREDANGSTTTRRVTSGLSPGRSHDRAKSPTHTNGASVSTKITGQHTTIDYGDTKHGKGKGGEVTVRTVTEEERTITGPTRKHITVTKTPVSSGRKSPRSTTSTTPRASSARPSSSTTPRSTTARSTTSTKSSTSSTPKSGWRR